MDADSQLRNLRDFLLVYNRMTEICFQRCTSNFNYRNLTMDEESCVDSCAGKLIRSNHRLMGTYVKLMPAMVQRRMEEMESKAAEAAKAAEMAAAPAQPLAGSGPTSPIPAAEHSPSGSFPPLAPEPTLSDLSSFQAPASSGTATAEVPLTLAPVPQMADATILSSGLQTANVSLAPPLVTELTPQASSPINSSVLAGIPIDKLALKPATVDSSRTTSAVPGLQSAVETKQGRTS